MIDKTKGFNWGPGLFLILYQLVLLATLPYYLYYHLSSIGIWIIAFILLYLTGISITGGYHRYYAHKTYKINHPLVEILLLFFSSMSLQGSALRWAFDHRLHHAHVDTDKDPYSIKKGFWYAHFLWILEKPAPIDSKIVPDLMRNKLVMFQEKYSIPLMIATNVLVFLAIGWIFNDFWGSFFVVTWLRIFALHHFTWFINSLAHTWGDKPFCQEQTAVNNFVIALLTFGEGYHNFHHTFANDYRNGIRWFQFDPTKWVLWTLSKLGCIHSLKKMGDATIKKRMVLERKDLLLKQIKDLWYLKKDEIAKQIEEISERLLEQLSRFNQLELEYRALAISRQALKMEIKAIQKNMRSDWRQWSQLSRLILHLKPLPA